MNTRTRPHSWQTGPHSSQTRQRAATPRPQSQRLQTIAAHWRAKTASNKRLWNLAAARFYAPYAIAKQTGYNLWVSVCSAALSQGFALPDAPPDDLLPALPLPPCALNATVSDDKTFSLTLTPRRPQPGTVFVYAAVPVVEAARPHRPSHFVHVATLNALDGPVSLGEAFGRRFPVREACWELNLKLVPLTPHGLRGTPVYACGVSQSA